MHASREFLPLPFYYEQWYAENVFPRGIAVFLPEKPHLYRLHSTAAAAIAATFVGIKKGIYRSLLKDGHKRIPAKTTPAKATRSKKGLRDDANMWSFLFTTVGSLSGNAVLESLDVAWTPYNFYQTAEVASMIEDNRMKEMTAGLNNAQFFHFKNTRKANNFLYRVAELLDEEHIFRPLNFMSFRNSQ